MVRVYHNIVLIAILFCYLFSYSQSNTPPSIDASGNQYYCPLSQINIATSFNIIDPDDTEIEALHIQISTGYVLGQDLLTLTGVHPNIVATWNNNEGKLSLRGVANALVSYTDLIAAVNDVVFQSSSANISGERLFSYTIGVANYLPSTGHFYEYVPNLGITWSDARILAETYTYYGLQGYLATITSQEEAQLSGEQAAGAGWIGGSDEETEGVWKWMTGPEAGTVFWNGEANGSTPNFAFWNTGEPNQFNGNEDYAHVTAPNVGITGSWNDLPNTGETDPNSPYHPQGFIVEYGGTPGDPVIDISASTRIVVSSVVATTPDSNCGSGSLNLQAIPSSGTIVWFDSLTGGNQLGTGNTFTTPILNNTTTYYVLASVNGCLEGERTPIIATIYEIPQIISFTEDTICRNASGNLTATASIGTVNWYTTLTGGSPIETGDSFTSPSLANTTTYYVDATQNGCTTPTRTPITITVEFIPLPIANVSQSFCNIENATISDLEVTGDSVLWYDAAINGNLLSPTDELTSTTYYATQTINGCESLTLEVEVTIIPDPEFEIYDTAIYCLEGNPITLETYNPNGNYLYQWTDEAGTVISTSSTATVESGGVFTVVATSPLTGCSSSPLSYTVIESEIAMLSLEDVTIIDLTDTNTITINNTNNNLGFGIYEFSLDDEFGWYQDESFFSNVQAGEHHLFVRDKNGCGVAELEFYILGFPKYFSPNNDGVNDFWNLDGYNNLLSQKSQVRIYDRYGKLIKQISPGSQGWDGTFNGKILRTNDYWFVAKLIDIDGTTRIHRGHFSLVR